MSAEFYDVIIIGGGPAGLATAYLCHKHNLTYLVLESGKAPFQGIAKPIHRASWFTPPNPKMRQSRFWWMS